MSDASESVEMYLKSVAELGGADKPVPIGKVADRLGVSPVSASEMMKRLVEQKYIDHLPYKGVVLTDSGRFLANSVIRRQRLWECFLIQELNLDWAHSFDLACALEHATNAEVSEALATYLNHPRHCPHGNPIPNADGIIQESDFCSVKSLKVGQSAQIQAIFPENSDVLTYLGSRGIRPGIRVEMIGSAPLAGPLIIKVGPEEDAEEVDLGQALAEVVFVEIETGKQHGR